MFTIFYPLFLFFAVVLPLRADVRKKVISKTITKNVFYNVVKVTNYLIRDTNYNEVTLIIVSFDTSCNYASIILKFSGSHRLISSLKENQLQSSAELYSFHRILKRTEFKQHSNNVSLVSLLKLLFLVQDLAVFLAILKCETPGATTLEISGCLAPVNCTTLGTPLETVMSLFRVGSARLGVTILICEGDLIPTLFKRNAKCSNPARPKPKINGKRGNATGLSQLIIIVSIKIAKYNHSGRLVLLSNDVEQNPGPNCNALPVHDKSNMIVLSYNVQGIKNFGKLKRLNNFWHKLPFSKNVIINLQETHLSKKDKTTLEYQWKWGSHQSTTENNSGGVAILYNKSFFDEITTCKSDSQGRMCAIFANKDNEKYFFLNIYAPNNHYDSVGFFHRVDQWITEAIEQDPTTNIIISGDFNLVFNADNDSVGRNQSKQENKVVSILNSLITKYNLVDTFRRLNNFGGYTWGRDNPNFIRSRLDYIFVSNGLSHSLISSNVNILPNESDHNTLYSEFQVSDVNYGPGIIRCNSELFEKPSLKSEINSFLNKEINEIPSTWNPHMRLDFMKYKLRDKMISVGREQSRFNNTKLEYANDEIKILSNELDRKLCKLEKQKVINETDLREIDSLKDSIDMVRDSISDLKEEESQRLIFRSRAKWAEKGEKSNKYFLNLIKERQKAMVIRKIVSNGVANYKQSEISKAIKNFYENLYKKQVDLTPPDDSPMFQNLPKLDSAEQKELGKPITLDELQSTLKTCGESAPGPDGISYKTISNTWDTMGQLILDAWIYSCKKGKTSPSQANSVITLLEKNGKDKSVIENLRPISLSNCDIKLCTKALALRTNKV